MRHTDLMYHLAICDGKQVILYNWLENQTTTYKASHKIEHVPMEILIDYLSYAPPTSLVIPYIKEEVQRRIK